MMRLLTLALISSACASFVSPEPFDTAPLRERAIVGTKDGIQVRAALLLPEQIKRIFGVNLGRKGIQPMWLEIENRGERSVYFLLTGMDPNYFSPFEASFAFHSRFAGQANRRLDAHLSNLAFDNRVLIDPGMTVSGFVYTNQSDSTKVVDLDLMGEKWNASIALFVPDPSDERVKKAVGRIAARFTEPELVRIEDPEQLRAALEGLPCCAQNAEGKHVAPLNIALVGELDEWVGAALRRNYRYRDVPALFAFQRPQDSAGMRGARWVDAQPHVLRLWQTPLRYRGAPVWLGQVSTPRGGRFARDHESLDPSVDRARDNATEDLLYSQHLPKVGLVEGAGCEECVENGLATDGLRAVLVFSEQSNSLAEISFFGWEEAVIGR